MALLGARARRSRLLSLPIFTNGSQRQSQAGGKTSRLTADLAKRAHARGGFTTQMMPFGFDEHRSAQDIDEVFPRCTFAKRPAQIDF